MHPYFILTTDWFTCNALTSTLLTSIRYSEPKVELLLEIQDEYVSAFL